MLRRQNGIIQNAQLKLQKAEKKWKAEIATRPRSMNRRQHQMSDMNPTISIITLNVNVLNLSIKRERLSVFIKIKKRETQIYFVWKKPTLNRKTQIKSDGEVYALITLIKRKLE